MTWGVSTCWFLFSIYVDVMIYGWDVDTILTNQWPNWIPIGNALLPRNLHCWVGMQFPWFQLNIHVVLCHWQCCFRRCAVLPWPSNSWPRRRSLPSARAATICCSMGWSSLAHHLPARSHWGDDNVGANVGSWPYGYSIVSMVNHRNNELFQDML